MNKLILIALLLLTIKAHSQSPQLIPYQAVARDAGGMPMSNSNLLARFTIHNGAAMGPAIWQEIQMVNTNALGLFTVHLGSAMPLSNIDWANDSKFMQVELDLGQGYLDIGTQQMLSVPYSLYSSECGNAGNGYSHVSHDGDTLYFKNGGFVIIPGISLANGGVIYGCTNSSACNYNAAATQDNATCVFPGCNDSAACNFNAAAACNDGSCYYTGGPCVLNDIGNFGYVWSENCSCEASAFTVTCGAIPSGLSTPPPGATPLILNGTLQTLPSGVTMPFVNLDDGYFANIPIGFNFSFFGTSQTTVNINTNGAINIGSSPSFNQSYIYQSLPNPAYPGGTVALCTRDLRFGATAGQGSLYYWTEGSAPNRRFIVQFNNVPTYSGGGVQNAEAVLYETLGQIDLRVITATNGTNTNSYNINKYIGLHDPSSTIGAMAPDCSAPFQQGYWNGRTDAITTPVAWTFITH